MKNVLEYKGYHTKIDYDAENEILYGKIEGINDLVDFQSDSPKEIEQEFHSAVDDYLALCMELNVPPDKEYRGVFNVRISPELHREISLRASVENITLNQYVANALAASVGKGH